MLEAIRHRCLRLTVIALLASQPVAAFAMACATAVSHDCCPGMTAASVEHHGHHGDRADTPRLCSCDEAPQPACLRAHGDPEPPAATAPEPTLTLPVVHRGVTVATVLPELHGPPPYLSTARLRL